MNARDSKGRFISKKEERKRYVKHFKIITYNRMVDILYENKMLKKQLKESKFAEEHYKELLNDYNKLEKGFKIIKEDFYVNGFGEFIPKSSYYEDEEKENFLMELLK